MGDTLPPATEFGDRRDAQAALRFVAHVSAVLAESLDYEQTLATVAALAVPFLADMCLVDMLDESGRMQRVAAAHRDPEVTAWQLRARVEQRRWGGQNIASEILMAGRALLTPRITPEILEKYVESPEVRSFLTSIGVSSGITVPLLARGRALGAVIFCLCNTDQSYGEPDLAIAEELARRAAVAIDNARLYRRAQEAVRARDEFLAVASHEFNTPITSLLMLAQTLQDNRLDLAGPVVDRSLELIVKQTRRLNALVAELLDVTRVQSGALQLRPEKADLVSLVRGAVERLAEAQPAARDAVSVQAPALVEGLWDRRSLDQVVTNLLSNALKFGAGKPVEILLDDLQPGLDGRVRLRVRDHGIGIPAEHLISIFEPFERAVPVTNYGGLGLGLYIVKRLVHALQGQVTVDSTIGVGSTFAVELPKTPVP